jgi:hypothetical protein
MLGLAWKCSLFPNKHDSGVQHDGVVQPDHDNRVHLDDGGVHPGHDGGVHPNDGGVHPNHDGIMGIKSEVWINNINNI